jgi:hypothetical protein
MHVPSVHTHIDHVPATSAHVKQVHVMQAHAVYEHAVARMPELIATWQLTFSNQTGFI